jgi:uncharacterized protein YndB with AHSA1/START domain
MDATTEATVVERTLSIAASPETVWDYFVDPVKAARWMGINFDFDPRPGGIYRCEVLPTHIARGEFVELDPPRRLVFTWGWEKSGEGPITVPPGSSTIVIELTPDGDGTSLHFVHADLPTAESVQSHGHGWDHYLARLEIAAAGGDPGKDPWLEGGMS